MKQAQHMLTLRAQGQGLLEITGEIATWVAEQDVAEGLLSVFIRHTSASILIQENADPNVQRDLEIFIAKLVPEDPHAYRNLSTTLRHRRFLFTDSFLLLWKWRVG